MLVIVRNLLSPGTRSKAQANVGHSLSETCYLLALGVRYLQMSVNMRFPPGEGACRSVVYRCVNKKKRCERVLFFELGSAQRCHHLE